MEEFKIIVRILAAIRASEKEPTFNMAYISESALKTTEAQRDNLSMKLKKEGYIDGLYIVDGIDNAPDFILWDRSRPSVTIKGLEYIQNSQPLQKAMKELSKSAIGAIPAAIINVILGWI